MQINILKKLWKNLSKTRKRQYSKLLTLMIFASFSEALSIGAVMPFLAMISSADNIPIIGLFIDTKVEKSISLGVICSLVFCISILLSGGLRLMFLWYSTKISFETGLDLSLEIYSKTLRQPYINHIERNSSEIVSAVYSKSTDLVYLLIMPVLTIISSTVMLLSISVALLMVDFNFTLTAFVGLSMIYALVISLTHKKLLLNSDVMSKKSNTVIQALQEGLGGIRDVILGDLHAVYIKKYEIEVSKLRVAQASNAFIGGSPRFYAESIAVVFISVLAYTYSLDADFNTVIPMVGALVLGAQRMLPIAQQLYGSWSAIRGGERSLQDALDLLDQKCSSVDNNETEMFFNSEIALIDISYKHKNSSKIVLNNVNIKILKGQKVGFIGKSGGGKSTFLDILMGLLSVDKGVIKIDNQYLSDKNIRMWQKKISHVPQSIFLVDATILENIALGIDVTKIDMNRIKDAARVACLSEFIEELPNKYLTKVGERGLMLSGGQRQRIGIARAIYKNLDVLVLDEATSALDPKTENEVMENIKNLKPNLTTFIVAHRYTSLKDCDVIYIIEDGIISMTKDCNSLVR